MAPSCKCNECQTRRNHFCECLEKMTGGLGKQGGTIKRRIGVMSEPLINDLRNVLHHLRQTKLPLTDKQRRLIKSHRFTLRKFTDQDPRRILAKKRRVEGYSHPIPLAQAIAEILTNNPTLLQHCASEISSH